MRKSPDPVVEAWVRGHPVEELFFSAVGEAELRYGGAILPVLSDIATFPCQALTPTLSLWERVGVRVRASGPVLGPHG